ncbi:MAG: hypothetical protein L6277_15050 [Desulfobacterales bacterium]|nr:hypothetical protein [Pseudomonadota bacterium]MBU4357085.1 hypothetical protein [Pseudomonadota bacterium]MCG2773391.1 hypothetical protein [Desulfobacterales bacterium]
MNRIKSFTVLLILLIIPSIALAGHKHPEKWYQQQWCSEHGGQVEVILPDKTRCDCLTETHAIEFDFGPKWAEAIGQALYYGLQTGKKPGIVLIMENEGDYKYWLKLRRLSYMQ